MSDPQWTSWRGVTESGWYWWWDEDEDSAPVPVSILTDGHGFFFASLGQLGWVRSQSVQAMDGWWKRLPEPDVCAEIEWERTHVTEPVDWRIGLTVKPKYRSDPLKYEQGIVLEVLPDGTNGLSGKDGVLKIKMDSGQVILRRADEWMTA